MLTSTKKPRAAASRDSALLNYLRTIERDGSIPDEQDQTTVEDIMALRRLINLDGPWEDGDRQAAEHLVGKYAPDLDPKQSKKAKRESPFPKATPRQLTKDPREMASGKVKAEDLPLVEALKSIDSNPVQKEKLTLRQVRLLEDLIASAAEWELTGSRVEAEKFIAEHSQTAGADLLAAANAEKLGPTFSNGDELDTNAADDTGTSPLPTDAQLVVLLDDLLIEKKLTSNDMRGEVRLLLANCSSWIAKDRKRSLALIQQFAPEFLQRIEGNAPAEATSWAWLGIGDEMRLNLLTKMRDEKRIKNPVELSRLVVLISRAKKWKPADREQVLVMLQQYAPDLLPPGVARWMPAEVVEKQTSRTFPASLSPYDQSIVDFLESFKTEGTRKKPDAVDQVRRERLVKSAGSWSDRDREAACELIRKFGSKKIVAELNRIDALAEELGLGVDLPPAAGDVQPTNGKRSKRKAAAEEPAKTSPATAELPNIADLPVVELRHDDLTRHPKNRNPTREAVDEMAASLLEVGQLDPIIVRDLKASVKYRNLKGLQVLSGETRSLGSQKLNRETIRGKILTGIDDALALRLLAIFNSKRKDLTPIDKARMLQDLAEEGFTREQAAKDVGLESASAASNLVRLLELPEVWQDRIASGELPQTYGRVILSAVGSPVVMGALEKSWKKRDDRFEGQSWESREALANLIESTIEQDLSRPDERWGKYVDHQYVSSDKCLLDLKDEELVAKLKPVTIERPSGKKGQTESVRYFENSKLYDELMAAAVVKRNKDKKSTTVKTAGERAEASKENKEQRKRSLAENIREWKDGLLRRDLVAAFGRPKADDKILKERLHVRVLAYLAAYGHPYQAAPVLERLLESKRTHMRGEAWKPIEAQPHDRRFDLTLCRWIAGLFDPEDGDMAIDTEVIESIHAAAGLKFADTWAALQRKQGPAGPLAKDPAFEEFWQMHRKDELLALAKELGEQLLESHSKAQMVSTFMHAARLYRLPACIAPPKVSTKPAKKPSTKVRR